MSFFIDGYKLMDVMFDERRVLLIDPECDNPMDQRFIFKQYDAKGFDAILEQIEILTVANELPHDRWEEWEVRNEHGVFDWDKYYKLVSMRLEPGEKLYR